MYLHALTTAVPPASFTQRQCAEIVQRSSARNTLQRRSVLTLGAILRGDSGVDKRHFAISDVETIFSQTPDELNERFRAQAPPLAEAALLAALKQAELAPDEIDALLICTCTGYLCPGVTSYVAERLGLRPNTYLQDLVGLGCGAAIPTLRSAAHLLASDRKLTVATVAVEICSAAFYLDDDPGVLISACLFSDGAAAAIWRAEPNGRALRCHSFNTVHRPQHRDKIRFEQRNGKLRNLLDSTVAELAADAVSHLLGEEPANAPRIEKIISHGGGRDVLDALERKLPGRSFELSRSVLRDYGNMSSPSVLFALERALTGETPTAGADWWLVAFGAGFSAHSCRFGA